MTELTENGRDFGKFGTSRDPKVFHDMSQDGPLDSDFAASSDSISHSLTNLEKRLATCSGIYDLASSANEIREKERSHINRNLTEALAQLDERISNIEETVAKIPTIVRRFVESELSERQMNSQIETVIQEYIHDVETQLDNIEGAIEARFEAQNKSMKAIKKDLASVKTTSRDNSSIAALEAALAEVTTNQVKLNDMMANLRGRSEATRI